MEDLQELITKIIKNIDIETLDSRIDTYTDFKSKYAILRPSVKVEVELKTGKRYTIDVSDYFEEVLN